MNAREIQLRKKKTLFLERRRERRKREETEISSGDIVRHIFLFALSKGSTCGWLFSSFSLFSGGDTFHNVNGDEQERRKEEEREKWDGRILRGKNGKE